MMFAEISVLNHATYEFSYLVVMILHKSHMSEYDIIFSKDLIIVWNYHRMCMIILLKQNSKINASSN